MKVCTITVMIDNVIRFFFLLPSSLIFTIIGQYGNDYEYDNKALGYLLKGVCLRIMKSPLHAEECFKSVISMEKKIKEDRFLVPYAHVELAFLHKAKGNLEKTAYYLDTAKYDHQNIKPLYTP